MTLQLGLFVVDQPCLKLCLLDINIQGKAGTCNSTPP
jgi:hypothetical protein